MEPAPYSEPNACAPLSEAKITMELVIAFVYTVSDKQTNKQTNNQSNNGFIDCRIVVTINGYSNIHTHIKMMIDITLPVEVQ